MNYLQVGNDILFYTIFAGSNLSGNKLDGSVLEALIQKSRDGSLILRLVFHAIYFIFLYFLVVLISSPPPPPSYCFLNMQNQYRGSMFICFVNRISHTHIYIYIYIVNLIYLLKTEFSWHVSNMQVLRKCRIFVSRFHVRRRRRNRKRSLLSWQLLQHLQ